MFHKYRRTAIPFRFQTSKSQTIIWALLIPIWSERYLDHNELIEFNVIRNKKHF